MAADKQTGFRLPAIRPGRMSREFADSLERYGASPGLLRKVREILDEQPETTQGVVMWGPPGTGKSNYVRQVIAHALAEGKQVLVMHQSLATESRPTKPSQAAQESFGYVKGPAASEGFVFTTGGATPETSLVVFVRRRKPSGENSWLKSHMARLRAEAGIADRVSGLPVGNPLRWWLSGYLRAPSARLVYLPFDVTDDQAALLVRAVERGDAGDSEEAARLVRELVSTREPVAI